MPYFFLWGENGRRFGSFQLHRYTLETRAPATVKVLPHRTITEYKTKP